MSVAIDPGQPLAGEVLRIGKALVDDMCVALGAAHGDPQRGFHDCRIAIKQLRALFALLLPSDPPFWRELGAGFHEIADAVAGQRAAAALVETFDRIATEFPRKAAGLDRLRDALVARRDRMTTGAAGDIDAIIAHCLVAAGQGLARFAACRLPADRDAVADLLAEGAARTVRKALKSEARARKHGDPDDFHALRKAVKAHAAQLQLLAAYWPEPVKPRLKATKALGDRLGDLNDIVVMLDFLEAEGSELDAASEIHAIRPLLKKSAARLRKKSLDKARPLFHFGPSKLRRRLLERALENADRHI